MDIFVKIAEERIREAMEDGEFKNLRGAGEPLVFEDETWIPEDLRLAYRVMKNAGLLPQEIETRKEILNLKEMMKSIDDDQERLRKLRELNYKILKLNTMRKRPMNLDDFPVYEERIIEKHSGF